MSEPSGTPPLLVAGRLDNVPGGPYNPEAVAIAESTIRGECGWHIAPDLTEERLVDVTDPGPSLVLPSLRVLDVTDVRTRDGAALSGWDWSESGILYRPAGWPRGPRAVRVTLRHGHTHAPAELVGLVAELATAVRAAPPGTRSEVRTVGGVTVNRSFTESGPAQSVLSAFEHVLARHRISVPA